MKIHVTKPLFAWDCLETTPSLKTIRQFLEAVPDAELLDALDRHRGHGRDDLPVRRLWGVYLLRFACRQHTMAGMLEELARNPALCCLIGIDSEADIPRAWNISRFETVLGRPEHLALLRKVFDVIVQRLGCAVTDLGTHTAGDSTALHARRSRSKVATPSSLPQATGGRKEYTDAEGNVTQVYEWFGYKLHLLVDTKHEVPVAYHVTSATEADCTTLPALVDQGLANLSPAKASSDAPDGGGRIKTLAYDKAADTQAVHEHLDTKGIKAVIQTRALWKDEPERMLPGDNGTCNIVYDEAGTVYCYDKASDPPVRHRMAFIGYEPSRQTLKYRCPAMHEHWKCPSDSRCNAGKSYGLTKRVSCEIDLRRFSKIPRDTKKFERLYKGRTAVERVNAREKLFWGADDGNVTGAERFHARIGTIMIVHVVFATLLAACPRREGTLSCTRLGPIAKVLQASMAT